MASRFAILALCCVASAAAADFGNLKATLGDKHGDVVDIKLTWTEGRCWFGFKPSYTIFYTARNDNGDNEEHIAGSVKDNSSFIMKNKEFWTVYDIRVRQECFYVFDSIKSVSLNTGPGELHPIESMTTNATEVTVGLTWTESKSIPKIPDQYHIQVCPLNRTGECRTKDIDRNTTRPDIEGLEPDASYNLTAVAIAMDNQTSYQSAPYNTTFVTKAVAIPGAKDFNSTNSTDEDAISVTITWKTDSPKFLTFAYNNFSLEDDTGAVIHSNTTHVNKVTFDDLPFNSNFTLRVQPVYNHSKNVYPGPVSSQNFTTPRQAPGPVSNFDYVALNPKSIFARWDPPVNSSANFYSLSYCQIQSEDSSVCLEKPIDENTTALFTTFQGLTNNTLYMLNITAYDPEMTGKPFNTTIQTLAEDYEAASEISYTLVKNTTESLQYNISWGLASKDVTYFTAYVIQDGKMIANSSKITSKSVNQSLDYFSDYSVIIQAVYNLKYNQTQARNSSAVSVSTIGKEIKTVEDLSGDFDSTNGTLQWTAPSDAPKNQFLTYHVTEIDHNRVWHSNVTVVAINNLTAYTNFTYVVQPCVTYHNKSYLGEKTNITVRTDVDAPGAVQALTMIQEEGSDRLQISWEAPAVKNGPVDFYQLRVKEQNSSEYFFDQEVYGTTKVSVVAPSSYDSEIVATVYAVNIDRNQLKYNGEETNHSVQYSRVGTPENVEVIDSTSHSLHIKITPGNSLNNSDIYYELRYDNDTQYITQSVEGNFTGLQAFTTYNISVRACLDNSFCGQETIVTGLTNVGAPSAVTSVETDLQDLTNPTVQWAAPDVKNGPISGYEVEVLKITDPDAVVMRYNLTNETFSFIHNETSQWESFNISVRAVNNDIHTNARVPGDSTHVTINTEGKDPAKPTDLEQKGEGRTEATVTWSKPANSTVVAFNVVVNTSDVTIRSIMTNKTTYVLTKLPAFTRFIVGISGCSNNTEKSCGEARKLHMETDVGAPGEPRDLTVKNVTSDSFVLEWSAPKELNGPLSGYAVNIAQDGKENDTWSRHDGKTGSLTFTTLSADTSYNVKVHAYNLDKQGKLVEGKDGSLLGKTDPKPSGASVVLIVVIVVVVLVVLALVAYIVYIKKNPDKKPTWCCI